MDAAPHAVARDGRLRPQRRPHLAAPAFRGRRPLRRAGHARRARPRRPARSQGHRPGAEGSRDRPREERAGKSLRGVKSQAPRELTNMPTEFKIPELGENVSAGDVVRVLVKPGDTIEKDQPVLELETDKATIEVPSSVSGTVGEVKVKQGDKVK